MDINGLIAYYSNLLVIQYQGKPKAQATIKLHATMGVMPLYPSIETVTFDIVPTQGAFVLSWNGVNSAAINWNDSAATVQAKLEAIAGLGAVTVAGAITAVVEPQLVVTMTGVMPVPAALFVVVSNTLMGTVLTQQIVTEDGGSLIVTEDGDVISAEPTVLQAVEIDIGQLQ